MRYYRDLREYISTLEGRGKLIRVRREIVKETELMPLVRLQFRGLPEEERRGFLFENVIDVKGRRYDAKVAVGILASSREIYSIGLQCNVDEIAKRWSKARANPIEPRIVSSGPCQEVVELGDELSKEGAGLDGMPFPLSTPGFSSTPRTTASHVVTKDPEDGVINVGNYQAVLRGKTWMTLHIQRTQHAFIHWEKWKARREPMPAAIAIGVVPAVAYASIAKLPYGVNEYAVAGGLAEEPIELVKCRTVDLEVPATAEIVIEGEISTDYMEPSTPFGEFTGYMAEGEMNLIFNVKCITHRRQPIFHAIISQFPPSESSKMRQIAYESAYYKLLRHDCNIPSVLDVTFYESSGSWEFCVIRMRKTHPSQVWQALYAAQAFDSATGKIFIAVDEDIDPRDPDSLIWAISFRMEPKRDVKIVTGRVPGLDLSAYPPNSSYEYRSYPDGEGSSAILIDATRKWSYPPTSLPKKEYMERAIKIWDELGLPKLRLKTPWYDYNLGYWTEENEELAKLAERGEFYKIGEVMSKKRIKV